MDACYDNNLAGRRWSDDFEDDWAPETFVPFSASSVLDNNGASPDCATINEPEDLSGDSNTPPAATQEATNPDCNDPWAPFLDVPYPYAPALGFHAYTAYWLENGKPGVVAYPELLLRLGGNGYTATWQAVKQYQGWKKSECMLYSPSPLRNEVKYEEQLSTTPPGSPIHMPVEPLSTTPQGTPPRFWLSWEYGAVIIATYQKEGIFDFNLRQDAMLSPIITFICEDELACHSDSLLCDSTAEIRGNPASSVFQEALYHRLQAIYFKTRVAIKNPHIFNGSSILKTLCGGVIYKAT